MQSPRVNVGFREVAPERVDGSARSEGTFTVTDYVAIRTPGPVTAVCLSPGAGPWPWVARAGADGYAGGARAPRTRYHADADDPASGVLKCPDWEAGRRNWSNIMVCGNSVTKACLLADFSGTRL